MGKSSAKIRFHRDVEVEFEFEVVPDQDSIKRAEAAAQAKAEVARMDAERAAAAEKSEESSFKYDNPLAVKEPKKEEPKAEAEESKPAEESTSGEA